MTDVKIQVRTNYRPFLEWLRERGKNTSPSDLYRDMNRYRELYSEYITILDPIALNRELRDVYHRRVGDGIGSMWRVEAIVKLAKYYKEEFGEDWLVEF